MSPNLSIRKLLDTARINFRPERSEEIESFSPDIQKRIFIKHCLGVHICGQERTGSLHCNQGGQTRHVGALGDVIKEIGEFSCCSIDRDFVFPLMLSPPTYELE